MSLFNNKAITVTPRSTGSYINGRWTGEVVGTAYTITGSWQPASQTDVLTLPEGRRERAAYRIYTSSFFNSLQQNQNPDRVSMDGKTYEVYAREDWKNGLLSHYKYIVTEVLV